MRLPTEWSEKDLLELIHAKAEEGPQLEFKAADSLDSSDKKKTEISKDVSAFANSAGGTIVYGIAELKQQPHCAESLSPVDPSRFSKEWLEQIINSRIQPRIQGVTINSVSLASGQLAYVVYIPQSTTAHQAHDHRYYRRYNFESVPMEDYEIRQTLNRTSRSAYEVRLESRRKGFVGSLLSFEFQAVVENVSDLIGRDVSAILLVPKHLIEAPDQYEAVIARGVYSRVAGIWAGTGASGSGPTIINIPAISPKLVFFERHMTMPHTPSSQPLRVFVRIFDRMGLALTTEVQLTVPDLSVISTKATQINLGP